MTIRNYNDFRKFIQKEYKQDANKEIQIMEESYHIKFCPSLTCIKIISICEDVPITFTCQFDYPFSSDLYKSWFTRFAEIADEVWHDCYDDPFELLMNYTNPYDNYTLAEMEKFLSQSIADGWRCPPNITAQELLEIYNEMNNEEEE